MLSLRGIFWRPIIAGPTKEDVLQAQHDFLGYYLHQQLGQLQQLRDFDLSSPIVQAKLRERYGAQLPLSEPVISPVSIFSSPELVTVVKR